MNAAPPKPKTSRRALTNYQTDGKPLSISEILVAEFGDGYDYIGPIAQGANRIAHEMTFATHEKKAVLVDKIPDTPNAQIHREKGLDTTREWDVSQALTPHKNIDRVTGVRKWKVDGRVVTATEFEFFNGGTLEDELIKSRLSFKDSRVLGRALFSAIASHHNDGFYHRDIKPANVLVNFKEDAIKLRDYQLATTINSVVDSVSGTSASTHGGHIFMDPTLLLTDNMYTLGSEFYSLGKTILDSITPGKTFEYNPDGGFSIDHTTNKSILDTQTGLPSIEKHAVAVENSLEKLTWRNKKWKPILRKLLSLEETIRYQSAEELKYDMGKLDRWYEHTGTLTSILCGLTALAVVGAVSFVELKNDKIRDLEAHKVSASYLQDEVTIDNSLFNLRVELNQGGLNPSTFSSTISEGATYIANTKDYLKGDELKIKVHLTKSPGYPDNVLDVQYPIKVFTPGRTNSLEMRRNISDTIYEDGYSSGESLNPVLTGDDSQLIFVEVYAPVDKKLRKDPRIAMSRSTYMSKNDRDWNEEAKKEEQMTELHFPKKGAVLARIPIRLFLDEQSDHVLPSRFRVNTGNYNSRGGTTITGATFRGTSIYGSSEKRNNCDLYAFDGKELSLVESSEMYPVISRWGVGATDSQSLYVLASTIGDQQFQIFLPIKQKPIGNSTFSKMRLPTWSYSTNAACASELLKQQPPYIKRHQKSLE
ncbi:MAG: serine/threonine protein kinase [Candidatus Woesearchaeota archaeon]|jgi:serine/threonine protein kinase